MRTVTEVLEWCRGAEEGFEDPSAVVGLMFARFRQIADVEQEISIRWDVARERLLLELFGNEWPLPVDPTGRQVGLDLRAGDSEERLLAYGIHKIASGLWELEPSLLIPGIIHVFVILYDVPSPAPWERPLIEATS